jgi:hypothetical protein
MIKHRTPTHFGKAFLWLIAVSVATLVEGYLMASTEAKETLGTLANWQEIPASVPEAAIQVDRVVEFVNFVVGLFQLAI